MSVTIPKREPLLFTAGTSWDWDRSLGDFPASDGWELSYRFVSLEAADRDITLAWGTEVTADGDAFEIRTPPAKTDAEAEYAAGTYELVGYVSDGTDTYEVFRERVRVLSNPATVEGKASTARFMHDAIDTAIRDKAALTAVQRRVAINNRSIEYASHEELTRALSYWKLVMLAGRSPNARLRRAARMVPG